MSLKRNNIVKLIRLLPAIFYLAFCFNLSITPDYSKHDSYQEAVKQINLEPYSILLESSKPELADDDYLISLKNQSVYADTLTYAIHYDKNHRYLIASIRNEFNKRIMMKLDIESFGQIEEEEITFSRALIAADITDVKLFPVYENIETYEREIIWSKVTYDVLLEGRLSDILYTSKI